MRKLTLGLILTALIHFYGGNVAYGAERVNIVIVAQIESNFNARAYNKHSGAIGICQIIPKHVLPEFNGRFKTHYNKRDLYKTEINMMIADWYLNTRVPEYLAHFKIKDTIDNRIWAYDAGIGNVVKHRKPKETRNYIVKYHMIERKTR